MLLFGAHLSAHGLVVPYRGELSATSATEMIENLET